MKILTVCRAGLVRSVSLANVLKLHYRPVDVLCCGIGKYPDGRFNSDDTLTMLFSWADKIIVMEEHYKNAIPEKFIKKIMVCEVGPDTYGSSVNPKLIDKVYRWVRENSHNLSLKEHHESI